ncbi:SLAIN motif-containing protein-like [Scophthalmus maximus]|uniref:SLAIN motif-containing protein-like n=1 Tax=Scophthalmus maximus TaxID=52904 RepID=UPI001FA89564|nr:SLAIN motif-containing protein-like [Scophthalmus maximus]
MELRDQLKSDWSRFCCNKPPMAFDASEEQHLFCSELDNDAARPEGSSHSNGNIWMDTEPARFQGCNSHSFAMEARMRLDHLKSGCNSPSLCRATDGTLYNYNCQRDIWDSEPKEEESALDLVELLDVGDDVQDEESWLYESPKRQAIVEKSESALRWCRRVLDNPSPEVEAACRQLINRLHERSSSHYYRHPAFFHHSGTATVGTSKGKSAHTTQDNSDSSATNDSPNTSYRLEDITDVRIMARIQEASLRQDYFSTPADTPPRRSPESPSYFNTAVENINDLIPGNRIEATSSSHWPPRLSSLSSPSCQLPTSSDAKQSCQSPKLARLHQQVTQFKLLKLAQNQATSAGRTRSPARTSLRSLQAVRNSRSLDTDDCITADQISHPPSGLNLLTHT